MEIAVILRYSNGPAGLKSEESDPFYAPQWSQRCMSAGEVECRVGWTSRHIPGMTCGWVKWRDGWALWAAERTIIDELAGALRVNPKLEDAAVIQASLDQWGISALDRTKSVWAGAVWQETRKKLHFFRDRVGIVPAVYSSSRERNLCVFSTSMALVHQLCPASTAINQVRLRKFLLVEPDMSRNDFFQNVKRLRPGEAWVWSPHENRNPADSPRIQSYWIPDATGNRIDDLEGATSQLAGVFETVANDYLKAGMTPLNTVSGGLDSTFMLAAQVKGAAKLGLDSAQIAAATMQFPSFPSVDETRWTRQLQDYLNHPIAPVYVEDAWPLRKPEESMRSLDLGPDFHPGTSYESAFLGRAFERFGRRPVFSGVGADHLFQVSRTHVMRDLFTAGWSRRRWGDARRILGGAELARGIVGRTGMGRRLRRLLGRSRSGRTLQSAPWRFPELWVEQSEDESDYKPTPSQIDSRGSFLYTWLWECVVRGFHRKSQRWRTSHHFPYLRSDFIEAVLQVDPILFCIGELRKGLLRKLTRTYLPNSIRRRPKGGVFSKIVEYGLGCREHSYIEHLFASESALADMQIIDVGEFRRAFHAYRSFCWRHQATPINAGEMLMWRTVAAEMWCRRLC